MRNFRHTGLGLSPAVLVIALAVAALPQGARANSPGLQVGDTHRDQQHLGSTGRQVDQKNPYIQVVWQTGPDVRWNRTRVNGSPAPLLLDNGDTVSVLPLFNPVYVSGRPFATVSAPPGASNLRVHLNGSALISTHRHESDPDTWSMQMDITPGFDVFMPFPAIGPQPVGAQDVIYPKLATDVVGADTVVHVVMTEEDSLSIRRVYYVRGIASWMDLGSITFGTPILIDSVATVSAVIEASPVSDDVAIVYTHPRAGAVDRYDNDVAYRLSTDGGLTWGPATTLFDASGSDRAFADVDAVFDLDNTLHVVFNTLAWDAVLGPLWIPCNLFHWNSVRGSVQLVASATWHNSCSLVDSLRGGAWDLQIAKPNLSVKPAGEGPGGGIAEEVIYAVWVQFGPTTTDCATQDSAGTPGGYVNGELWCAASSDDGLFWDPPQNITGTETPNCQPGNCHSEHWVTAAAYADSGVYLSYLDDRHAGAISSREGEISLDNPYMLYAIEAREPVPLPVLDVAPTEFILSIPPDSDSTVQIVIRNLGTAGLPYAAYVESDDGGPSYVQVEGGALHTGFIDVGGAPDTLDVSMSVYGLPEDSTYNWRIEVEHINHVVSPVDVHLIVTIEQPTTAIHSFKFHDVNGDGIQDLNEPGLAGWVIRAEPGGYAVLTDATGGYRFLDLPAGTYTLSEELRPGWVQTYPSGAGTHSVVLPEGKDTTGFDFGNYTLTPIQDLSISVAGGKAKPGFEKTYSIFYENRGSTIVPSVTMVLELDPAVGYLISDGGTYAGGPHTVMWTADSLVPGEFGFHWARVTVSVGAPLGDTIVATATINPVPGDDTPGDNQDVEGQEVRGAFDPNEKLVAAPPTVPGTDTLRYQINFQNVGNDTAINIVVRDTIDANLDLSTVRLGAASHPYVFTRSGRECVWTFDSIFLPDSNVNEPASNGFLTYKILPQGGLAGGTVIANEAAIYFDFNPPVVTNTVVTTIGGADCPILLNGDVNLDTVINAADIIYLVNYTFKSGPVPLPCEASGDANCDVTVTAADVIWMVVHVFKSGPPPCDVCTLIPGAWTCP